MAPVIVRLDDPLRTKLHFYGFGPAVAFAAGNLVFRILPRVIPARFFDAGAAMDALQWPAMVVTVLASWLVASSQSSRRNVGFWMFMGSNVLWIAWGLYRAVPALVTLQLCLAVMNIRGAWKTENK